MTDLEARRARRAIDAERDDRLWLGDVFGRMEPPEIKDWAQRLGKNVRTAYAYRHTAKACTPTVRQTIADSRVLVSYTILREGAHTGPAKIPHDEGYATLERLIEEAQASDVDHISVNDYRIALNLGPSVHDLSGPDGVARELQEYFDGLGMGPERDRQVKALAAQVREQAEAHRAVRAVLAAESATRRKRESENIRLGISEDPAVAEGRAFAKSLYVLTDLVKDVMRRYAALDPTSVVDERNAAAVTTTQATIEVFSCWLNGNIDQAATGTGRVPAQRRSRRTMVAA
jgi:hypothetical protein